ncbi:MAG: lipopolysaccharide kinase InaA family protein [Planctomycetota bacterium]
MKKEAMVKVEFAKDWASIFEEAGLKSLEDFFEFSAGQTVNKNKKREVVAMTLDTPAGEKEFFMKRFFKPHFKDTLFTVRNFGRICSQAGCEWRNINTLLDSGIDTYHPVCYGRQMHFGLEKKSFIITEKINGMCLTDFVAADWLDLDQLQKENIIAALAKFVRKIHNAKISMPDLYLWHIFMTKTPLPDQVTEDDFAIIDLHRMRINVSNRNDQIRNLGALDFSMSDKYFDDAVRELFLNAYTSDTPGRRTALYRKIKSRSHVLANRRRRLDY